MAAGSIDLAARTGYGQGLAGRGRVLRLLEAMPPGLRAQAVRAPLALCFGAQMGAALCA
ncbi:hypothetical protein ACTTAM_08580 [Rhodobacter capsulatus]|uniref:hypothetical protein n=1 Tax=Rhodobacter capsulatus TaxID=1061 RepID=UPI004026E5C7